MCERRCFDEEEMKFAKLLCCVESIEIFLVPIIFQTRTKNDVISCSTLQTNNDFIHMIICTRWLNDIDRFGACQPIFILKFHQKHQLKQKQQQQRFFVVNDIQYIYVFQIMLARFRVKMILMIPREMMVKIPKSYKMSSNHSKHLTIECKKK